MKILTVVGARPNFMKAAPIIAAINERNLRLTTSSAFLDEPGVELIEHVLVHTGQHYDEIMSGSFFSDLNLPSPDIHLGIGSASHAVQTAEIMKAFEAVLAQERPHFVVVVGDVNSTLACALVASKISFGPTGLRPLIAHVEAGLRSFDRSMPEEINRVLTDHAADLLFVSEESGLRNLCNEGIPADRVYFVGNTMIDSLLAFKAKADNSTVLERLELRNVSRQNSDPSSIRPYSLLTLHRPSNVDNRDAFVNILMGLQELASQGPVIFPVHPRTRGKIEAFALDSYLGSRSTPVPCLSEFGSCEGGIVVTDPLGYLDFMCLMKHASIVVTDSGGIQEETTCLGIPCVTVRENTERPVTVERGTNIIAGTTRKGIRDAIRQQRSKGFSESLPENWDGHAAERILDVMLSTDAPRVRQERQATPPEFASRCH